MLAQVKMESSRSLTFFGLLLICVFLAPAIKAQSKQRNVDIYSFHINSTVTSRYAITVITSCVANSLNESQEVHFQVKIPKNAFISKFRMTIEGKTYDGIVKKKEEAQQQYSQAVSRGQSAGLVSSVGRTLEEFKTSVTVAALSKVTFELTYEELLKRRLGKYELLINAQPTQPVADFKIDVYIHESPGISLLEVKGGLSTNELTDAVTTTRSGPEAWVKFYPTREQQKKCKGCGKNGLNGDMIILYDVDREKSKGELRVSKGHFVHYFAPTDVQRIPKNVVFVIDRSGSMSGRKMEQTRVAMLRILGDLSENDHFGIITFDGRVKTWKPELLKATQSNVEDAKKFVKQITARGSTDINAAVLKGVELINRHPQEDSASILILLTDGEPTTGVTSIGKIQDNVKKAIQGKFPLYCLGFGFDVSFEFLKKMAMENDGVARRIYEDSDADQQLQGFYEEVATPLLTDIHITYTGAANVTQTNFSQYYNGSEIVVAGLLTDNSLDLFTNEITATSISKRMEYHDTIDPTILSNLTGFEDFIERLWAYLTVKQLLEKELMLEGQEKEAVRKETLDLSLKYNFVTPLTSMVVTKPQEEDIQVAHKPKERKGETRTKTSRRLSASSTRSYSPGAFSPRSYSPGATVQMSHSPGATVQMSHSPGAVLLQRPTTRLSKARGHQRRIKGGSLDGLDQNSPVILFDSRIFHPTHAPPTTTVRYASPVRFLIQAQDQSEPLCYDIPASQRLRLLQDPSSDFSMNGELIESGGTGFSQITIFYKTDLHMRLSTSEIIFSDGRNAVKFLWNQEPTTHETDSVSLILRNKEMDVSMGNSRVVILLHEQDGNSFLWPAVRQRPSKTTLPGLFGTLPVAYTTVTQSHSTILKIQGQEVRVSWNTATDYSIHSAPRVGCWLVPFQVAMQGELSDFTVPSL
ncbi:inter-alpha-trypsin inhibitor heavy chain H3 isoform X1 [Chanos chanos]|uniref:Inter-alpha-trypsin inhibitor heavy chain H3 isoform X1 n=1 Tax=Chanos chanos TaxID=29144 RepID=A0A6J2VK24_CHACN|nr:inter-alpha-trypsin inhibitor heavy chain H3-like isoform X1 [Chanos chanos]